MYNIHTEDIKQQIKEAKIMFNNNKINKIKVELQRDVKNKMDG
jgi:hypothetical protein